MMSQIFPFLAEKGIKKQSLLKIWLRKRQRKRIIPCYMQKRKFKKISVLVKWEGTRNKIVNYCSSDRKSNIPFSYHKTEYKKIFLSHSLVKWEGRGRKKNIFWRKESKKFPFLITKQNIKKIFSFHSLVKWEGRGLKKIFLVQDKESKNSLFFSEKSKKKHYLLRVSSNRKKEAEKIKRLL